MMSLVERVLLVDDDPNVLKAYERRLRKRFDIETALCSEEGITTVNILGPFAVIVSDMSMPREDGADFLARMLEVCPDSVRIMLTGNADQATAVKAVNRARVFHFLSKPCPADELEAAIQSGIEEYRRKCAERELMGQTVQAVVSMLTQVLALASPLAFGRASRLRSLAKDLADAVGIADPWELEIAASLSQLGAVAMTSELLHKLAHDIPLEESEQAIVSLQYRVAADLIGEAPRLETIARCVALQTRDEKYTRADTPLVKRNAALLRIALAFDHLVGDRGMTRGDALCQLLSATHLYGTIAIEALKKVVTRHDALRIIEVDIDELCEGMQIVEDVVTTTGVILITKGQGVTTSLCNRLATYAKNHRICTPVTVQASNDTVNTVESARLAV
jgi:ActR/RegA family two-component response regulator